jgi:hypothetical protein
MKEARAGRRLGRLGGVGVLTAFALVCLHIGAAAAAATASKDFSVVARGISYKKDGTRIVAKAALLRRGQRVGTQYARCNRRNHQRHCRFIFVFAKGRLFASGPTGTGTKALPIRGGTGRYRGADGAVQGRDRRGGRVTLYTFRFHER